MLEIVRDAGWQFAGVVVSLVAVVATFIVYGLQRRRKRLAFFARFSQLVFIDPSAKGKVSILFEGEPVEGVRLAEFGVKNAGEVEILGSDFFTPLSFVFETGTNILSVEVSQKVPHDLPVAFEVKSGLGESTEAPSINVAPLLLNPGDEINFKCLLTKSHDLVVSARIAGVRRIEPMREVDRIRFSTGWITFGFVSGVAAYTALYAVEPDPQSIAILIAVSAMVFITERLFFRLLRRFFPFRIILA
jgi:hypothetical protein